MKTKEPLATQPLPPVQARPPECSTTLERRTLFPPATSGHNGSTSAVLLRTLLAFVILPNLPFWIAPYFCDTAQRGYLNVEYLGWGILFFFLPKAVSCAGISLSLLFDIIHSSAQMYYFNQQDLGSAFSSCMLLSHGRMMWISTILITVSVLWGVFLVYGVAPSNKRKPYRSAVAVLLAIAFVGCSLDIHHGRNGLVGKGDESVGAELTGTGAVSVWYWLIQSTLHNEVVANTPIQSASGQLLERIRQDPAIVGTAAPTRNIVLILVESYGQSLNSSIAQRLQSSYQTPEMAARYDVSFGDVPFHGATVSGEFRELCGMRGGVGAMPDSTTNCLPNLLAERGYSTSAFHGFSRYMFRRQDWYQSIGFQNLYFRKDMDRMGHMNLCQGAFPGICDADVARLIGDKLTAPHSKPDFLYWVTLNSHLPVDPSVPTASAYGCGSALAPVDDRDVCTWMSLVDKVHHAIATLALRPGLPPTEFIIVGDHAPPFLEKSRRDLFSQEEVPYIRLVPREKTPSGGTLSAAKASCRNGC